MTLPVFPDVHEVLFEVLVPAFVDDQHIGTVTPADLETRLPFVRVRRIGGPSTLITDRPRLDVEVYAATIGAAFQMSREIQQALISGPRSTTAGIIDRCTTEVGPREAPYENTAVRLVMGTYRLSLRR